MRRRMILFALAAVALLGSCFMPTQGGEMPLNNPFSGKFLTDSGAPASGLGHDGDLYLDTDTATLYVRRNGSWGNIVALKGASGSLWLTGSGAPAALSGSEGDLYLDTGTTDVYRKSGGSWGLLLSLKGQQGATGAAAPALQIQYSADGSTGWTAGYASMHYFMRSSSDGGSTWSAALRIRQDGTAGENAPVLQVQYSVDGSTSWTASYASNQYFMRFSPDGGTSWSGAIRFRQDGTNGRDGTTWYTGGVDPDDSLGIEGDLYLNTASTAVFLRGTSTWSAVITSLKPAEPVMSWRIKEAHWYNFDDVNQRLWPAYTDTYQYAHDGSDRAVGRIRDYWPSATGPNYRMIIRDSLGRTSRQEIYSFSASPYYLISYRCYSYDTEDNLYSRIDYYNASGVRGNYEIWTYDGNRRHTSTFFYDSTDAVLYSYSYLLDAQGNPTSGTYTADPSYNNFDSGAQTSLSYSLSFTYDGSGNNTEVVYRDAGNAIVGKDAYTYDAAGHNTSITYFLYSPLYGYVPVEGCQDYVYETYTPSDPAWSSNDASLKSLAVGSAIPLVIGTYEYGVTVDAAATSAVVSVTPTEPHATLYYTNGVSPLTAFTGSFTLNDLQTGSNGAGIQVVAQDGASVHWYTLLITKPEPTP